jgi:hypothetical protein
MQFIRREDRWSRDDGSSFTIQHRHPFTNVVAHVSCFHTEDFELKNWKLKFTWPNYCNLSNLSITFFSLKFSICQHMTSSPDHDENELIWAVFLLHIPTSSIASTINLDGDHCLFLMGVEIWKTIWKSSGSLAERRFNELTLKEKLYPSMISF